MMKHHDNHADCRPGRPFGGDALMEIYKRKSLDGEYLEKMNQPLLLLNASEIPPKDSLKLYQRNNFPFWVFEFVVKGQGTVEIEDNCFSVSQGSIYILPKNRDHRIYSSVENPWIKRFFLLVGTLPEQLLKSYRIENNYHFPDCGDEHAANVFSEMIELFNLKSSDMNDRAASLLLTLVQYLSKSANGETPLSSNALKIRHYLDRMLYKALNLDRMSSDLAMPRNKIIKICKSELRQTPYDYFLSRKVNIGKTMLAAKGTLISEVAAKLNFVDQYHFSRIFKARTGISPSEYKKQLLASEGGAPSQDGRT